MIFLFLLVVLSVAYSPVFRYSYVYHDGVWFFKNDPGSFEIHPLHMIAVRCGRFVMGFLYTFIGWFIDSVQDLKIFRLVGLFQMVLCAYICMIYLRKYLSSALLAVLACIIIFTQPAFQALFSNDSSVLIIPSILLSLCAGILADKIPSEKIFKKQLTDTYSIASILVLFLSISVYQTGGMFFWILVGLVILSHDPQVKGDALKRLRPFIYVGFMALFIYALFLRILEPYYAEYLKALYNPLYDPYSIEFNVFGKLKWFVQEPLFNSLNLWSIFPEISSALLVAGVVLSGFFLRISSIVKVQGGDAPKKAAFKKLILNLVVFVTLFFLSFLPNFVAKGNAGYYRCCVGLTTMIVVALIWSLKEWSGILPVSLRKKFFLAVLLSGSLWGVLQAHQTVLYYRALPSHIEKYKRIC